MRIPDFEGWDLFVAVAEAGSFAGAARARGLSVPTVSRAIARLVSPPPRLVPWIFVVLVLAFGAQVAGQALGGAVGGVGEGWVAGGHPTDAQLVAMARQYFKKFDNMAADPSVA